MSSLRQSALDLVDDRLKELAPLSFIPEVEKELTRLRQLHSQLMQPTAKLDDRFWYSE